MLIFEVVAVLILLWFAWQLYRAKQFTKFKRHLSSEIKPKVVTALLAQLEESRCEEKPNNECHQQAAIYYWTQYQVRILQYALESEILTKQALKQEKQWRHCQHLFHVEQQYLAPSFIKNQEEN